MHSLTRLTLSVGSLGAYLICVCGVDVLFNGTTIYTVFYGFAGVLLDYRPRLVLSAWGIGFFTARGIYGIDLLAHDYRSVQLLTAIACAGAHCLADRQTAEDVRTGLGLGPYLRPGLLIAAASLIASGCLFRIPLAPVAGWTAFFLLVWLVLPKSPRQPGIPLRPLAVKIAAILFLCVLTLALTEAATRIFLRVPPMRSETVAPHSAAIMTLAPGMVEHVATQVSKDVTKHYTVANSSQGIRDRYYGSKKRGEYRIAMLGDSFTWGAVLELDETIPKVLERTLRERNPGCDISVINAGVGGYAPWQERIFLRERVFALEPDAVVLQLYPENDVPDSLIAYGEYVEAYLQEWRSQLRLILLQQHWPMRFERALRTSSDAYRALITATGDRWSLSTVLMAMRLAPDVPPMPVNAPRPYSIEPALRAPYPALEKAWRKYEQDIAGIVEDCRARGIAVLVCAIPSRATADRFVWAMEVAISDLAPEHYQYALEMERTKSWVEGLSVEYVDLLPAFSQAADPQAFYYVLDGHLCPEGVAVVVDNLAETIERAWPLCAAHDVADIAESARQ
jgi:hypothetical protein